MPCIEVLEVAYLYEYSLVLARVSTPICGLFSPISLSQKWYRIIWRRWARLGSNRKTIICLLSEG
jgi:hypothetical protein